MCSGPACPASGWALLLPVAASLPARPAARPPTRLLRCPVPRQVQNPHVEPLPGQMWEGQALSAPPPPNPQTRRLLTTAPPPGLTRAGSWGCRPWSSLATWPILPPGTSVDARPRRPFRAPVAQAAEGRPLPGLTTRLSGTAVRSAAVWGAGWPARPASQARRDGAPGPRTAAPAAPRGVFV